MSAPLAAPEAAITPGDDTRAIKEAAAWRRILGANGTWVLIVDIVLVAIFTYLNPVFFSLRNLQNLLLNGSEGLLLALAVTMLLGAGLFDLSIGANLVLSSIVGVSVLITVAGGTPGFLGAVGTQQFSNEELAILAGLIACVVTGGLIGAFNGFLVAYLRINSLIATLGTLSIATGVSLLATGGADIGGLPPMLRESFGFAKAFELIPLPAIVALAVMAATWIIIRYLRFGSYTLAIGSSRVAAERSGIRVSWHLVKLSVLAGGMAGLAGFISLAHFGATTLNGHTNDPLTAITAAVIGGTALSGGRVSILGTLWGTALALILIAGLVTSGVSAFYQLIVIGGILLVAVATTSETSVTPMTASAIATPIRIRRATAGSSTGSAMPKAANPGSRGDQRDRHQGGRRLDDSREALRDDVAQRVARLGCLAGDGEVELDPARLPLMLPHPPGSRRKNAKPTSVGLHCALSCADHSMTTAPRSASLVPKWRRMAQR